VRRRSLLWLVLSIPSLLLAGIFATRKAWEFTAILAVLGVALLMRAWEERNPPDG
jgi:ABC-type antimicrobial peptide transport system permease subunit